MALLVLLACLACNVLIAWAMLQQPYYQKPYHCPLHEIQLIGYIWSFLNHNLKSN